MPLPDHASCEQLLAHVQADPMWSPAHPHEVGGLSYWKHARLTMTKFAETTALEVAIPRSDWRPDFREVYRREAIDVLNRAAEEGRPIPTLNARLAAHVAFGTRLREASMHRELRWDPVPGLHGQVPGWVVYEAEQMLDLVNALRAENGLPSATLEQVLRVEQSACGHSDYPDKYALRCAFLALGEEC